MEAHMAKQDLTFRLPAAAKKKIKQISDDTLADFIEDLPEMLRDRLESSVAKMLGFDYSFGRWNVQNGGSVGKFISEEVKGQANDLIGKMGSSLELSDEMKDAIRLKFASALDDCLWRIIREAAQEKAKAVATELINGDIKLEVIKLPEGKDDVADPRVGRTRMEQLSMAKIIEREMNIPNDPEDDDNE